MHPSDVIQYLRLGEMMTLSQIANHLSISLRTIVDWQPPECWGLMIVSQDIRARRREWMKKVNQMNRERHIEEQYVHRR
jgi:hypothetical protein